MPTSSEFLSSRGGGERRGTSLSSSPRGVKFKMLKHDTIANKSVSSAATPSSRVHAGCGGIQASWGVVALDSAWLHVLAPCVRAMDKQDFAQIKRQQDRSTEAARAQDGSAAVTYNWHGLADERPLPPFGAMSVSMARQFNRRLLDERFPLGNEKPVKGLAGSSLNMLRPNSASSRVRKKKPRPRPSSDATIARETVSLLDKYVTARPSLRSRPGRMVYAATH